MPLYTLDGALLEVEAVKAVAMSALEARMYGGQTIDR
jgi:hypothetical protein